MGPLTSEGQAHTGHHHPVEEDTQRMFFCITRPVLDSR